MRINKKGPKRCMPGFCSHRHMKKALTGTKLEKSDQDPDKMPLSYGNRAGC